MNKSVLRELITEIDECINLQNQWVLFWSDASLLRQKLKNPELLQYFENRIVKLKYEKLMNRIQTIWNDQLWYTTVSFFEDYKILLNEEIWINKEQKYFSAWEEKEIVEFLKKLFSQAESEIIIYDTYLKPELIRILANLNSWIKISLFTLEKSKSKKLEDSIQGLCLLLDTEVKKVFIPTPIFNIHDRFYFIDNECYSFWASVNASKIRWTMFHPIKDSEVLRIKNDILKHE